MSIELLRDLPAATSVSVTPISADDWEILVSRALERLPCVARPELTLPWLQETNAEFVEMNLLNQARAVREGMVIGCWVGGTTLVRFVVGAFASPVLRC